MGFPRLAAFALSTGRLAHFSSLPIRFDCFLFRPFLEDSSIRIDFIAFRFFCTISLMRPLNGRRNWPCGEHFTSPLFDSSLPFLLCLISREGVSSQILWLIQPRFSYSASLWLSVIVDCSRVARFVDIFSLACPCNTIWVRNRSCKNIRSIYEERYV